MVWGGKKAINRTTCGWYGAVKGTSRNIVLASLWVWFGRVYSYSYKCTRLLVKKSGECSWLSFEVNEKKHINVIRRNQHNWEGWRGAKQIENIYNVTQKDKFAP